MLNLARKTRVFYFESVLSLKSVLNFIAIQKSIGFWRKLKPIDDDRGSKNIRYPFWALF